MDSPSPLVLGERLTQGLTLKKSTKNIFMKTTTKKIITVEQAIKAGNDGRNQEIKAKFVGIHVYCNVGSLVDYCLKQGFEDSDNPVSLESIENYCSYPEWRQTILGETLYFEGGSEDDKDTFLLEFERLQEESERLMDNEDISQDTHERNLELIEADKTEFEDIESEDQEIFEWWAVSSFLFDKLKEFGYPVVDAGSCYVWGRTTTGQAILLDGVITRICADMEILEGQENAW